jgi:hypothetical protein
MILLYYILNDSIKMEFLGNAINLLISTDETVVKLHRIYEDDNTLLINLIENETTTFLECADNGVCVELLQKLKSSGKSDEESGLIELKLKYYIMSQIQKSIYEHTVSLLSNIKISDYSSDFIGNGDSRFNQYLKENNIPSLDKASNTLIKSSISTKATPKKATPKKATPKKATPKKATPKKATPKKATPKKATPKKATPKKATPKKAIHSEGIPPVNMDVRKHPGIFQSGAKVGELRPGYTYTGNETKTGLKVISKKATPKKAPIKKT